MKRKCTADSAPRQGVTNCDNVSTSSSDDGPRRSNTVTPSTPPFCPLNIHSVWNEPGTTTRMITVAIILPSGIGPGDFSLRVVEGGRELELTVQWPNPLTDLDTMHKKWLLSNGLDHMERYHPKYLGFEAALKHFREHSTDKIESFALFPLPFAVQTHIHGRYNLGWKDNAARMVYVDLKAYDEMYAVLRDENSFEMC